jgi:rhamnose transport system permease protein
MSSAENTQQGLAGLGTTGRSYVNYGRPLGARIFLSREAAVIAALVIVWFVAMYTVPYFGGASTLDFTLLDAAPILMIALPMTYIIITGEIDLSVASVLGLSSVTLGLLVQAHVPIVIAMIACLIVGVVCGAINGFLITVVGLPSIAVTIGTMALYRGIAVGLLGTTAITKFPEFWQGLAQNQIGSTGIPIVMVLVVILVIVFGAILHFTSFGRGLFALGLSKDAAAFSGIKVNRSKFITYVLSGLISAVAGIDWTLRYAEARGDNGTGLELSVIAAVLLGGVSIFGGKGALPGVLGGVLLIGVLDNALQLAGVSSDAISVVTGAVLILSVVAPQVIARIQDRRAVRLHQKSAPVAS